MGNGNGAGRPSKLTPEVRKRLVDAIAAGNYYEPACTYAGISYSAFAKWMAKGREGKSGEYVSFLQEITQAEAQAHVRVVAEWQKQIPEDWRAARDFLARRYPEWRPKEDVNIGGQPSAPLEIKVVYDDGVTSGDGDGTP